MRRIFLFTFIIVILAMLGGCSENELDSMELTALEVEFEVPEAADVGESIELKAIVTYGEEFVDDADEVVFEVWEKGNREDAEMIDGEHQGDGIYTAEISFEYDGIFEMYAHTTARNMHTMPKKEIIIGEGGEYDEEDADSSFHTEGFDMHIIELNDVKVNEEVELMVHITMNDEPYENLDVRYEIWNDEISDQRDWIDTEETSAGDYVASHTFPESGVYHVQIHVEDDKDLHEHIEYELEVTE